MPKNSVLLKQPLNLNNLDHIIVKGEFFLGGYYRRIFEEYLCFKIEYEECNCATDIPWRSYIVVMRGFAFFLNRMHVYLGEITIEGI